MRLPTPAARSGFPINHHSFHLDLSAFPPPTFSIICTHIIWRLFPCIFHSYTASIPYFINKQLLKRFPEVESIIWSKLVYSATIFIGFCTYKFTNYYL